MDKMIFSVAIVTFAGSAAHGHYFFTHQKKKKTSNGCDLGLSLRLFILSASLLHFYFLSSKNRCVLKLCVLFLISSK